VYNNLKIKTMKKNLITDIRLRLDFMEEFDTLLSDAKKKGDEEWEDELYASLSSAECDLRELVAELLGEKQPEQDKLPF